MRYIVVFCVLVLAGCARHEPVVLDVSDTSVRIEHNVDVLDGSVEETAAASCAIYNKRPKLVSTKRSEKDVFFVRESLYACQ